VVEVWRPYQACLPDRVDWDLDVFQKEVGVDMPVRS
jgi:hypothetical protein